MIEHIGLHTSKPTNLVDDLLVMGQQGAQFHAALSVSLELAIAPEELCVGRQERKAAAVGQALWGQFAMEFPEHRLVLEKFELAWATGHEQINDVLDPRRNVEIREHSERLWRLLSHHRLKGDCPKADTCGAKNCAAVVLHDALGGSIDARLDAHVVHVFFGFLVWFPSLLAIHELIGIQ
jgi:hypothetical protein